VISHEKWEVYPFAYLNDKKGRNGQGSCVEMPTESLDATVIFSPKSPLR
jgi:hypothetical protein